MRRWVRSVSVLVLLGSLTRVSSAEGAGSALEVTLPECSTPPLDLAELARLLALELQLTSRALSEAPAHPHRLRLALVLPECSESAVGAAIRAPSHPVHVHQLRASRAGPARQRRRGVRNRGARARRRCVYGT
jgi:hypothetical protein